MITRVRLENWKAFSQLDHAIPAGTSFIVARNGVGKTSLLQALQFGLFGDRKLLGSSTPIQRAVRGGISANATVLLNVTIDGLRWEISRKVPGGLRDTDPLPEPTVTRDGARASSEEWIHALEVSAGVDLEELRLLAAIGEGDTLAVGGSDRFDLIRHLSNALGVSRMREVSKVLRAHARDVARDADSQRLTLRDRPVAAADSSRERIAAQQAESIENLKLAGQKRDSVAQELAAARLWDQWDLEQSNYARATHEIQLLFSSRIESLPSDLDSLAPPLLQAIEAADLQAAVTSGEAATAQLRERINLAHATIGEATARLKLAEGSLAALDSGDALCPTCRRPLSPAEESAARIEHLGARDEAAAEIDEINRSIGTLSAIAADFVRITGRAASVRFEPVRPEVSRPSSSAADLAELHSVLSAQFDVANQRHRELEAQLRVLDEDVAARRSDSELSRRLQRMYVEADVASVAATSLSATADRICSERIDPLAAIMEKRFSSLWPGGARVSLDSTTGAFFANSGTVRLEPADLSGGERTVATVLLRLLALQSASRSPVLLLDEPLEHLDPRNRRMLASLLVAASHPGPPRQILVTTYEESVTRRLGRDETAGNSSVIYIRGASSMR